MSEEKTVGSRAEWSARVQRFTDIMLERLNEAWKAKDRDEKDTRAMENLVVKLLRLWKEALPDVQHDPRLLPAMNRVAKQASEAKSREE